MEEKVLIKGEFLENLISPILFICGIISTIVGPTISNSAYSPMGYIADGTKYHFGRTITYIGIFLIFVAAITLLAFGLRKFYELVVTDKRVYGKVKFGRRVDLPIDSITAIGVGILKSISVTTASGSIKFIFMKNRDQVFDVISELIRARQSSPIIEVKNDTSTSNADELKKYKDLLDNGVITQEEFDAKKKQLLGL